MTQDFEKRVQRWMWLILIASGMGLAVGLTIKLSTERQQGLADHAAEGYAKRVQPLVAANPHFQNVEITRFSAIGVVRIGGHVESDEALAELHQFIESQSPPSNIRLTWPVRVVASDASSRRTQ